MTQLEAIIAVILIWLAVMLGVVLSKIITVVRYLIRRGS